MNIDGYNYFKEVLPSITFVEKERFVSNNFNIINFHNDENRFFLQASENKQVSIIITNRVGLAILNVCRTETSIEKIVDELFGLYEDSITRDKLLYDVIIFVRTATNKKILRKV